MKIIDNDWLYNKSLSNDNDRLRMYETSGFEITKLKSVIVFGFGFENYIADATKFELSSKPLDEDYRTFKKFKNGEDNEWILKFTAIFDGGSEGSLHAFLWDNAGLTTNFIIRPLADISESKKYYVGQARIPYRPGIKSKVDKVATFDYEMKIIGQPGRSSNTAGVITDTINEII